MGITRQMTVSRLTSSIGAQVDGLRLTDLDAAGAIEVLDALHEHGVLVFRNQPMDRDQQYAFTAKLGPVHGHPIQEFLLGGEADPWGIVENDEHKPSQDDQNFHVDYSFNTTIPDLAVLRAEVIPPRGGDTVWSNAGAAYDALSPTMQGMLQGLQAIHDAGERFWFEMRRTIGEEATNRCRDRFGGNRHPVVGPHPFTGRMLLFVNPGYTTHIEGLTAAESRGMLRMLFDHVNNPSFHYRHRWQPDDVVVWDEHLTTHMGPNDFAPAHRRLARLTAGRHAPCSPAA
jgi:taurine dioxygenase